MSECHPLPRRLSSRPRELIRQYRPGLLITGLTRRGSMAIGEARQPAELDGPASRAFWPWARCHWLGKFGRCRPENAMRGPVPRRERAADLHKRRGRYWDRTSDLFGVNEALSR